MSHSLPLRDYAAAGVVAAVLLNLLLRTFVRLGGVFTTLLIATLKESRECNTLELNKQLGQTCIRGQGMPDEPPWHWPD